MINEQQAKKIERLKRGESFVTTEHGNSMIPLIYSGQGHVLCPVEIADCEIGDIVFCVVDNCALTHLVTDTDLEKGLQISNNRGKINGWTKEIYGKVVEVLND